MKFLARDTSAVNSYDTLLTLCMPSLPRTVGHVCRGFSILEFIYIDLYI